LYFLHENEVTNEENCEGCQSRAETEEISVEFCASDRHYVSSRTIFRGGFDDDENHP
jgi:hypothetical protein